MKRTPMILLSAILELIRILLLALGARLLVSGDSNMVNSLATILLMRILIVSSFVFPALLLLAWFNASYAHFLTPFIPLKIALLITDVSSFFTLLINTVQQVTTNTITIINICLIAIVVIDSFIMFSVNRELRKLKKPQSESPTIETVELS